MNIHLKHLSLLFPETAAVPQNIHYQLPPQELVRQTLERGAGQLSDTGALCISTGTFTGRSPKDKFIVRDTITSATVDWNGYNKPIEESRFLALKNKMLQYLGGKNEVWVRDVYACAHPAYHLPIRMITEQPSASLFCSNLFLQPEEAELALFKPEWQVLQVPRFEADPESDGTRTGHFAIISFAHKTILIGGTAYTGEIKKSVFTVLNFLLPQQGILSMHCSVNRGNEEGDVAVFFGLSGTGKTTLSADPQRKLVGDDEHGWAGNFLFNFEGGCYAKIIHLSGEKEPAIYNAIRKGALVENVLFYPGTNRIDFSAADLTENTRVSYPLHYIPNSVIPSLSGTPKNIFFLTCDAFGVLPPLARLTSEQAMYYFISGYTAKVAGTETGITEPKATFSACFGAPFLPLHPVTYANLLVRKIRQDNIAVWMVNTGWTGGGYGVGKRIDLKQSRAMIGAVVSDAMRYVHFTKEPVFGLFIPNICQGVDQNLLVPRNTWHNPAAYDEAAHRLAVLFQKNFSPYSESVGEEVKKAGPQFKQKQTI